MEDIIVCGNSVHAQQCGYLEWPVRSHGLSLSSFSKATSFDIVSVK